MVTTAFSPASAAASCFASTCDGKFADDAGCWADRVEMSRWNVAVATPNPPAHFFYSPTCRSVWVEFDMHRDNWWSFWMWSQPQYSGVEKVVRGALPPDCPSCTLGMHEVAVAGFPDVHRTIMVSWEYSVKACVVYYTGGGSAEIDPDPTGNAFGNSGGCSRWV
jgi:hypothetical protein